VGEGVQDLGGDDLNRSLLVATATGRRSVQLVRLAISHTQASGLVKESRFSLTVRFGTAAQYLAYMVMTPKS